MSLIITQLEPTGNVGHFVGGAWLSDTRWTKNSERTRAETLILPLNIVQTSDISFRATKSQQSNKGDDCPLVVGRCQTQTLYLQYQFSSLVSNEPQTLNDLTSSTRRRRSYLLSFILFFIYLTSPWMSGMAPMAFCRDLTSAAGPVIRDVPVSTMASQPPLQRLSWLPTAILTDKPAHVSESKQQS